MWPGPSGNSSMLGNTLRLRYFNWNLFKKTRHSLRRHCTGYVRNKLSGNIPTSRQRKKYLPTRRSFLLNPKIGLCPEIQGFISIVKLSFNLLLILEILVIHIKFLILFSNPISQALLASTMFCGNKFQSLRHCLESKHKAENLAFLALPPQPHPTEWKGSSYR